MTSNLPIKFQNSLTSLRVLNCYQLVLIYWLLKNTGWDFLFNISIRLLFIFLKHYCTDASLVLSSVSVFKMKVKASLSYPVTQMKTIQGNHWSKYHCSKPQGHQKPPFFKLLTPSIMNRMNIKFHLSCIYRSPLKKSYDRLQWVEKRIKS